MLIMRVILSANDLKLVNCLICIPALNLLFPLHPATAELSLEDLLMKHIVPFHFSSSLSKQCFF